MWGRDCEKPKSEKGHACLKYIGEWGLLVGNHILESTLPTTHDVVNP